MYTDYNFPLWFGFVIFAIFLLQYLAFYFYVRSLHSPVYLYIRIAI